MLATCRDEDEQTQWLCERILAHREQGTQLKEQAVLFRAQHHSMALEMELSRRNIPFHKYGGLRFVEMAHVKDLVSFLRLAENPKDSMAGLRVLGLVPGIGPKTAAALLESLGAAAGDFPAAWSGARVPSRRAPPGRPSSSCSPRSPPPARPTSRRRCTPCAASTGRCSSASTTTSRRACATSSRSRASRRARRPARSSSPSWCSTRRRTRRSSPARPLLDEDYLILSTMHSAKGLEFDVVYVIHAADGNIPSDMATGSATEIEEERRLLYVACTRAREQLYVSHPLRYYTQPWAKADTHGYAQRSRFLSEAVAAHFEQIQTGPEGAEADEGPLERVTTASIRAGVRSLWEAPAPV